MLKWIKNVWSTVRTLWQLASDAQFISNQTQLSLVIKKLYESEIELQNLKNQLNIKQNTNFDGEFLWFGGERICLRCYDSSSNVDKLVVRLLRNDAEDEESFYCVLCKTTYKTIAAQKSDLSRLRELSKKF